MWIEEFILKRQRDREEVIELVFNVLPIVEINGGYTSYGLYYQAMYGILAIVVGCAPLFLSPLSHSDTLAAIFLYRSYMEELKEYPVNCEEILQTKSFSLSLSLQTFH